MVLLATTRDLNLSLPILVIGPANIHINLINENVNGFLRAVLLNASWLVKFMS